MRRIVWIVFVALLAVACSGPGATSQPSPAPTTLPPTSAPTQPPATVPPPTSAPTTPPTSAPTTAPTDLPPTAARTDVPSTAVSTGIPATAAPAEAPPTSAPVAAEPTAPPAPQAQDIASAGPVLPDPPLDPQAQAAALLPDFQGDLNRATDWNRYTIVATIDPQARTIAGRQRLEYTNRDSVALDRLYFHLYPNLRDFAGALDIAAVSVDGQAVAVTYEDRRYLLRVDLPAPLAPGATTTVTLDFTTSAPQNASARFYGAFNRENGIFALASSYPIVAIVRGGAWDIARVPDDNQGDFVNSETSLYDVTLSAPANWDIVTTGVAVDHQEGGSGQTARIVTGPQRDFMIALTDKSRIVSFSADVDGTQINSYVRAGRESGGQLALQAAADSLRAFNLRFGRYPLAELDVVEVTARTFSGVEYPGLIMIEQGLYTGRGGLEITVAHEVGHQWWYSLVGNDVQTESWLDEALASYSQIVYQEQVNGSAAAERELDGFRQRYRNAIAAGRDNVVERPTSAFRGNYVSLVYGKAVLFFQALRVTIGDEAFDRFLHDYYARRHYGFVGGGTLLADAEGACGCELDSLYAAWITSVTPVDIP